MAPIERGTQLWTPSASFREASSMHRYMRWLEAHEGLRFSGYEELHAWSVRELPRFWATLARYFEIRFHTPASTALGDRGMPGARFFPGATLNYAEHALRREGPDLAVVARDEAGATRSLGAGDLRASVARARAGLVRLGVTVGDVVAGVLPNAVEALVSFLAAASLGATWTCCAPEFGADAVLDRLRQVSPKVLIATSGYRYGGAWNDRRDELARIVAGLPSLAAVVIVGREGEALPDGARSFADLCVESAPLTFASVPFDHPLWVLFSSGTTGVPKGILHGHGGILLEHLKALSLHADLGPGRRFLWYSTTGWMMWNYLVGGLLVGATVVLYDGHPAHPEPEAMFGHLASLRITDFGTSAPFLLACEKRGLSPREHHDLSALVSLGSTGAPLPVSGFRWVHEHVKPDLWLASISGGTDVCTAFLTGCPLKPVRAGEIQCVALGVAAAALDENGQPVTGDVGELVITAPMPSMPVGFVGDPHGERLRDAYFAHYPGLWRHGDFVELTPGGGAVVYGRSDATMNRSGVRMGTAEFYRVLEEIPEIADSLVVDTGALEREDRMWLFVVLGEDASLTDDLTSRIRQTIRAKLSPRHVPDSIVAVPAIPRTLNGKKLEVPVKRLLMGVPRERVVQPGTLANEAALDELLARATRT